METPSRVGPRHGRDLDLRRSSPVQLKVLFEDERIVAVSKPGGMLVHRTEQSRDRVVVLQTLARQIRTHLFPVHRLDRAASGVLIFAKSSTEARLFHQALAAPCTVKEYVTLVRGETQAEWTMDRPLHGATGAPRESETRFARIANISRSTLLQAYPRTGRRHQIRRHLAHAAHQVIGDTTYGKGRINRFFRENYGLPRLFLHARSLRLTHPADRQEYVFQDPLAPDLREFLERLPDFSDTIASLLWPITRSLPHQTANPEKSPIP